MKKTLLLLAGLLVMSISLFAQVPEAFKYQAIVRDNAGNLLANQTVGLKFNLISQTPTGQAAYSETFSTTSNPHGLVNVEIGKGTPVAGSFAAIDWSTGPYFIEIFIDREGGTNYVSLGVNPLLSVPYALYAKAAGNGFSGDYNDLQNTPDLSNFITSPNDADADPNNEKITSIQLNGSVLEITEGGRTYSVDLGPLMNAAYSNGRQAGYTEGYDRGYDDGFRDGYNIGYDDGYYVGYYGIR